MVKVNKDYFGGMYKDYDKSSDPDREQEKIVLLVLTTMTERGMKIIMVLFVLASLSTIAIL